MSRQRIKKKKPSRVRLYAILALLGVASVGAAAVFAVSAVDMAPRQVAPYVERRASGHNKLIEGVGGFISATLGRMDQGAAMAPPMPAWTVGAQPASGPAPLGRPVSVSNPGALVQAIAHASAGDVITLEPGTYPLAGMTYVDVRAPGTKALPITVRARTPGSVVIESHMSEGFLVSAPYWTFENLTIRGVCKLQGNCEHAFHVTGGAHGFVSRNNTVTDFSSHFKINAHKNVAPDDGLVENNTISNNSVRDTNSSVTPLDLVASSRWVFRNNLVHDFIKGGGDNISYGGFAKGAGSGNVFERNVVLCEHKLRGFQGQRIGLSLGGGGTGMAYCRDKRCITEQDGGVIQSNFIASCSDEGIYLNRAATSKIVHNTVLDTAGVMVRFVESSATIDGNIVDGRIRGDRGAILREGDNLVPGLHRLYMGSHPQRDLFRDALGYDLSWSGPAPRRLSAMPGAAGQTDLCGKPRPAQPAYGATEDFAACLRR